MKGGMVNWQNFIRGLIVSTLIFSALLLFLTFFASPEKGAITIIVYYVSMFFFFFGIAAIINFLIRRWWMHNEVLFDNVKTSIRQSVLFSGLIVSLMALSAMRLLTWWDGLIMGISFLLIELYFKTRN
jgi:amino acid transporter